MSDLTNIKDIIKATQQGNIPKPNITTKVPAIAVGTSPVEEVDSLVSNDSKSLQTGKTLPIKNNNANSKSGKEVKKIKSTSNSIAGKINSLDKLNRDAPMVHIRITPETHKKLLLYQMGEDKLSIQSIVNYAIVDMLDSKEMKELLNVIKNGMV